LASKPVRDVLGHAVPKVILDHPLVAAIMAAFPGGTIDMATAPKPHKLPDHFEKAAIVAASETAGDYIEKLGKTDMATWSQAEWYEFLEVIILTAREKMTPHDRDITDDEIPF